MLNGYKIKSYINKNKITQSEFADMVGVSTPTISKLINKCTCDLDTLIAVANTMNVSLDYLFDRNINDEKQKNIAKNKQSEIFDNENSVNEDKILLLVEFNKENMVKLNLRDRVLHILNE
jgi:transcriptional regulator with XRE-family HTH domain